MGKKKKKMKMEKNGKKEQMRQLVKETGSVSMSATWFIRIDTYLHMHQVVHIIAYCVWGEKWELGCFLGLSYRLIVYSVCVHLVICLLGWCNCLSCIHDFPIICVYVRVLEKKKQKRFSFVCERIFLSVLHLKTLTWPQLFGKLRIERACCIC